MLTEYPAEPAVEALDPQPDMVPTATPVGDRRAGGKRHQSVLLIGRVSHAKVGTVCLVHDISRAGLMARFATPPQVGEPLRIEVRGLPAITGTVRWVRGFKAGMQFDEPQDLDRVFCVRRDDGTISRAPRFPASARAALRLTNGRIVGELIDISAGGAKLAVPGVAQGQTGALVLPDVDLSLFGSICWTRDDRCGFRFAAPLPLVELSKILAV